MITASEARNNVTKYSEECFISFCSAVCEMIKEQSKIGQQKVSISIPKSVRDSENNLKTLVKDLTSSPNLFQVSFYENNSIIVISWV